VFLRLEISWFLAVSPTYLLLGPKPTSDLRNCKSTIVLCGWVCECALGVYLRCRAVGNLICNLRTVSILVDDNMRLG